MACSGEFRKVTFSDGVRGGLLGQARNPVMPRQPLVVTGDAVLVEHLARDDLGLEAAG